jgi:hypothetical protein
MYNNDTINSTELNQRLEEILFEEYAWIEDDSVEPTEDEEAVYDEYSMLVGIIEDGKQYHTEWDNGIELVSENHFTDYIKETFISCGIISQETLNVVVVDWYKTADKARYEYKELTIQGTTYLMRAN